MIQTAHEPAGAPRLLVVPTALMALPAWGDTPAHQASTDAAWARLGALGKAIGFRWGGELPYLADRPHFEWAGGLTLAQLRGGARPGGSARDGP